MWSALLTESSVLRTTGLGPLVRAYLATLDSTGDVERALGDHANFLNHHAGRHEGGSSLSETCHLLKTHGPKTESELFTKGDQGDLLFTAFTRDGARSWLALHGRRFACSKQRTNAGVRNTCLLYTSDAADE